MNLSARATKPAKPAKALVRRGFRSFRSFCHSLVLKIRNVILL